jgi:hypothetical protein
LTNSPSNALLDVPGAQAPRFRTVPEYVSSAGVEVIELAAMAGLYLDPWQQRDLTDMLGERADGKWACFEFGEVVSRQNGKGGILEARELGGLFLLPERMLLHTAHQFDTSLEAFRRLLFLIENCDDLRRRVKRVVKSHGEEGIELLDGTRIRFRTRTSGGGRGFSGDFLALDESMILPKSTVSALMPTLSAMPNPQIVYTGSAVDEEEHVHGLVMARVRDRGIRGEDPRLGYVEYGAPFDHPDEVGEEDARNEEYWAQANPGLGIRITTETVAAEQRSMDPRAFAVERLGVGAWPKLDTDDSDGITRPVWDAAERTTSVLQDPIRICVDVHPERRGSAIVAVGLNQQGVRHIELVEYSRGTAWVPGRVKDLLASHQVAGKVLIIARSPAAALIPKLTAIGIEVEEVDQAEYGKACGAIVDDLESGATVHIGQPKMQAAALGAKQRSSGETLVWSRKSSAVDICPFVAATVANHYAADSTESAYEKKDLVVL